MRIGAEFPSTDKQQACQPHPGAHYAGRSTTCDAGHDARARPRRAVFLIRHSLCFKNVAERISARRNVRLPRPPALVSAPVSNPTQECDKVVLGRDTDGLPRRRDQPSFAPKPHLLERPREPDPLSGGLREYLAVPVFSASGAWAERAHAAAGRSLLGRRLQHWYASCRHKP